MLVQTGEASQNRCACTTHALHMRHCTTPHRTVYVSRISGTNLFIFPSSSLPIQRPWGKGC